MLGRLRTKWDNLLDELEIKFNKFEDSLREKYFSLIKRYGRLSVEIALILLIGLLISLLILLFL